MSAEFFAKKGSERKVKTKEAPKRPNNEGFGKFSCAFWEGKDETGLLASPWEIEILRKRHSHDRALCDLRVRVEGAGSNLTDERKQHLYCDRKEVFHLYQRDNLCGRVHVDVGLTSLLRDMKMKRMPIKPSSIQKARIASKCMNVLEGGSKRLK